MPSTIQLVRPTPRFGGDGAADGTLAVTVGIDDVPAALFQTSVDAVQAGATLGTAPDGDPEGMGAATDCCVVDAAASTGATPGVSGTTSANVWSNGVGVSVSRAPQFQQ
jgi:hypothetical protein